MTSVRVLLDVGAHHGQTLHAALMHAYSFDLIYSFEPSQSCWSVLDRLASTKPNVSIQRFGLLDDDIALPLHQPGAIGASIFAAKSGSGAAEHCTFKDAGRWWDENIPVGARVTLKLNVEGSELRILKSLHRVGALSKVRSALIHFDSRKVPGLEADEAETIRLLKQSGIEWIDARDIMFGRNTTEKTTNWLRWLDGGPSGRFHSRYLTRATYAARVAIWHARRRFSAQ